MNAHNPVNLTYGGREAALLMGEGAEEVLVRLSQLISYGMLKLTDDFPGDLLWFTREKNNNNQNALHHP